MADIHDIVMFSLAGRLVWGRGPDWVCVTMGTLGHLPRQQHCSLATSRNTVPIGHITGAITGRMPCICR